MRVRLIYKKGDRVRCLGHLDVQRCLHMALSRAGWPVSMSKGFSPRPKIAMYSPLPVGTAGFAEILDADLAKDWDIGELSSRLIKELPQGFEPVSLENIEGFKGSLEPLLKASLYSVDLGHADIGALERSLDAFLKESSVLFKVITPKRERVVDLRPFLKDYEVRKDIVGLDLTLAHIKASTVRPAWIIESLKRFGFNFDIREAITDRRKILFDN